MPSAFSFSRICQSGLSSRAARSAWLQRDSTVILSPCTASSLSGMASRSSRRSRASLSKKNPCCSTEHLM